MRTSILLLTAALSAAPAYAQSNLYFDSSGGKIGIGTSTPANTLDVASGGGIHITDGTPSSTANALYSIGSVLQWNGAPVGGGSSFDSYPDTNTLLLLHADNNANDSSVFNNAVTNSGVTFSSSTSKFGGYSAFFNGSATNYPYLATSGAQPVNCAPNCTIDLWVNFSGNVPYASQQGNYAEQIITFPNSSTGIQVSSGTASGPPSRVDVAFGNQGVISQSYAFSLNTWYHMAVEIINGSAAYVWINGTQVGSTTSGVSTITPQAVRIGSQAPSGYYYPVLGYIDEFRISSAVRYRPNANFTPPARPYNPGP